MNFIDDDDDDDDATTALLDGLKYLEAAVEEPTEEDVDILLTVGRVGTNLSPLNRVGSCDFL
ncbi:hypothetical protein GCM10010217_76250 [Streptomyces tubercidicus]